MKKVGKLVMVFLMMAGLAQGAVSDDFRGANEDYEAGRFQEAVEGYERVLESEGLRASVLGNLGSACFKMGENGRAIFSFERGLLLRPGDPDLRANLKLAQDAAAVFPVEGGSAWGAFMGRYSLRVWSLIALCGGLLLPVVAFVWVWMSGADRRGRMVRMVRMVRMGLVVLAGVDLVVVFFALSALRHGSDDGLRAIVLAKPAVVRISPFGKADKRGTLAEGREVSLGQQSKGYFWVSVDGGLLEGWVLEESVAVLVPVSDEN